MAKGRRRKTEETPVEGDSCAALVPRLEKLEKAFQSLVGVSIEEYSEESEADNPVIEEHRFDKTVIKKHKDGKLEHLRVCEWCGAEVNDLATHKARCPKRPIW